MERVLDVLLRTLRGAAAYNSEVQVRPACILWPDRDRQWEAVVPRLQNELSELLVLGDYHPEKREGPGIWLRCVIAGKTDDILLPNDSTPILYLPGISRQDLRAVETCPDNLKPLAELQYRGVIWSQINGRDWTVLAFLKSDQGGLGLDVAQDRGAISSMQLALYKLLDEDVEFLKAKRLDKDFFNTLLSGGDPIRDLLQWLDQGDAFRSVRTENEWRGFVEVCRSLLAFNPEKDGILTGAAKLATHEGPWVGVWERFCEAPHRYPNIPAHIGKCKMPELTLFSDATSHGSWPQWNQDQEADLRKRLLDLINVPENEGRKRLVELEARHRERRQLVWTDLGQSPLACAIEHLAILAEKTAHGLDAGTTEDLAAGYRNYGWQADAGVLRALACVDKNEDFGAVTAAIRSVYLPWAEDSAHHLQKIVNAKGYPGGSVNEKKMIAPPKGECFLFVDGLRFDVARRVADLLLQRGHSIEEAISWAALPTVTATGKPAAAPIRDRIKGTEANAEFEPCVAETGQSLKGGHHFKKQLEGAGWQVPEKSANGNVEGNAWCEFGNIDHEGHERGWKLAKHLDGMLTEIVDRVEQLLAAGWKTIRIVTDHGWLFVPGGLPKTDLESALVEHKWGRCAAIKSGAVTDERLYPWYWNPEKSVALARGVSCYRAGEEYAHGGLSLQECLILELTVSQGKASSTPNVVITEVIWKGLRCNVSVEGEFSTLRLDVRLRPGDSTSSLVKDRIPKPLKDNGTASVVMQDDEFEGADGFIVLVDTKDELVAQVETVIGGDGK
jgi:hypothetical protein